MLMKKRLLAILGTVTVVAAACGSSTASTAPSTAPSAGASAVVSAAPTSNLAADQIFHIDLGTEPPTLDPNKAQDSTSIAVLHAINRGLVYFDKDLKVVPELADSYEVSTDAKTITFHLKSGIKYSNGDPIVAGDFVYGWKRLVDPRTAAPYSYVMGDVVGGSELLAMAGADPAPTDADIDAALAKLGVAAPDEATFVVTLATPATYFLSVAALWIGVPVEKSWITSPNATEAANYVGSGPFILDTWEHNSSIVLKPNPQWGGTKPTLTEIDMSMTAEPATAQAAYEAGALDMVATPSEDSRRVGDDPVLSKEIVDIPQLAITYYVYNNKSAPTSNKNLRIALTQSINKQEFIDTTFAGLGVPANSFIMPGIPGYQKDLDPYPYDPAAAKEHMATALTELGVASAKDLGKLKFGFNSGSGHEPRVAYLAEQWNKTLGLDFEQIGLDFAVFLPRRTAGDFSVARDGWGADYPHANNQLNGLFTCGGGNNDSQYCNADFDALIKQAAAEPDQDKQVALYNQAQTILMNDAAMLPLRFGVTRFEVKPYVSGYLSTPSDAQLPGDLFYETISILKHD